jgi:hypothetical protein
VDLTPQARGARAGAAANAVPVTVEERKVATVELTTDR